MLHHDGADLDPSWIVIDEVAGYMTAVSMVYACGYAINTRAIIALLVLFRFFDIVKPGPIGWIDRSLAQPATAAWGIMLDDIAAGVAAAVVYIGWKYFFNI